MKISYELMPEDYWQFVKYYRLKNVARPAILYTLLAMLILAYPFVLFEFLRALLAKSHHTWMIGLQIIWPTGVLYGLLGGYRRELSKKH